MISRIVFSSFLIQALGSGINVQLAQNPLLREIFQLGAVVVEFDKEEMRNAKKQHVSRDCDRLCLLIHKALQLVPQFSGCCIADSQTDEKPICISFSTT